MKHCSIIFALALLLCLPLAAGADVFTDDFEDGTNLRQWTFGIDQLDPVGGNPGYWLHSGTLDTFAPILRCGVDADFFTGDYVTNSVTRISGDFRTDFAANGTAYYPFSLLLKDDNDTPNDVEDDVYVYWVDENNVWCPQEGAGWTHYDFTVPSDFVGAPGELPAEWMGGSYWTGGDVFPDDRTWQDVISSIDTIEFWWFHPAWFGIFTQWEVGADNIEIEYMLTVATEESSWSSLKSLY